MKIAEHGADLVRLTVQGRFEADACLEIRQSLLDKGCNIPLVADIHFAPAVALRVADAFEKVRINPGNFADGKKSFENKVYNTRVRPSAETPHCSPRCCVYCRNAAKFNHCGIFLRLMSSILFRRRRSMTRTWRRSRTCCCHSFSSARKRTAPFASVRLCSFSLPFSLLLRR
jgi:hypothetical protein